MAKVKKEKKRQFILRRDVISTLRRLFGKSLLRSSTLDAAKVYIETRNKDGSVSKAKRVNFKCAHCNNLFPYEEVNVDHTEPVLEVSKGFNGWEEYVRRLFVGVEVFTKGEDTYENLLKDKLSVLCTECHNKKSETENAGRREIKKSKNKAKKDLIKPKKPAKTKNSQ